jgi:hypothetical protein
MKKIHKIAAVMFVSIGIFSSQSMSAAATNLKCSGCVGKSDIAKNAVVSSRIKIGAVTSGKIKDGAVNFDKLGPDVQVILDAVGDEDFSGYGTPFSAIGAPVNVVVFRIDNGDGSFNYSIRSRYENDSDVISVQGSPITPLLIANYGSVFVDGNGDITNIDQYIEAPQTQNYLDFTVEEKSLDPANPASTPSLVSDNIREVWTCSGGGAIDTCAVDTRVGSVSDSSDTPIYVYEPLGPGTINGMSFPDLRGENGTYSSGLRYRVRAKGIGTVLTLSSGRPSVAIYYRVNGATGGSLAGTPFEAGQPMDGIWF